MRNVFSQTNRQFRAKLSPCEVCLILISLFFAAGCSQSVNSVSVVPRNSQPRHSLIANTDVQGATTTAPTSASFNMGIHSAGGSNVRTNSTSASYRLVGGIGVD